MNMWIQLHDFSTKEMGDVTLSQSTEALSTFDWQSELSKRDESDDETCDPGLGLVAGDETILHICPQGPDEYTVHYLHPVRKKILGFIPFHSQKNHFISSCPTSTATKLIEYHFDGKRDEILKTK